MSLGVFARKWSQSDPPHRCASSPHGHMSIADHSSVFCGPLIGGAEGHVAFCCLQRRCTLASSGTRAGPSASDLPVAMEPGTRGGGVSEGVRRGVRFGGWRSAGGGGGAARRARESHCTGAALQMTPGHWGGPRRPLIARLLGGRELRASVSCVPTVRGRAPPLGRSVGQTQYCAPVRSPGTASRKTHPLGSGASFFSCSSLFFKHRIGFSWLW